MCVFKYHAFIFYIRPPRWRCETVHLILTGQPATPGKQSWAVTMTGQCYETKWGRMGVGVGFWIIMATRRNPPSSDTRDSHSWFVLASFKSASWKKARGKNGEKIILWKKYKNALSCCFCFLWWENSITEHKGKLHRRKNCRVRQPTY